jgi:tartrate dehydrogenase/decarboxylase / D-malate dehydrogenase
VNVYRIALIPGDGVGKEVIVEGLRVVRAAGQATAEFRVETTELPWSCEYYLEHGEMMPADGMKILADHDAIYLGAVGFPGVPDSVSLWGLLLPIRQGFDQYVNLRPVRVLAGITSPLRNGTPDTVDMLCVRENTEGEYSGIGGRFHRGREDEVAVQTAVFSRRGIERVVRYAFDRARERRSIVASATKSNALQYSAVLWDEVVQQVAGQYPDVALTSYHVDALAARFVTAPDTLDVVVASNLFGDILTDLGGAVQGSLGLPASANLNPERRYPSMFEPVHGSAPRRAGQGVANPMAAVWAGAMMLEHLGAADAARLMMEALEDIAMSGPKTKDLGGSATTSEVGSALVESVLTRSGSRA